ncbi:RNA polymerase sigma factor [candidate division CSSED10-310 bacterium]|uniref:RNA polymerase sigma factor n=1 Tax=candidate division CSSED10-310 bacterium TaxID=2855610 RepID=A0ABV6YS96_UNCC1
MKRQIPDDMMPKREKKQQQGIKMAKLDVEDLYRRYGFLVFKRCSTLLGREDEARDAMQEVFMKALKYGYAFNVQKKPVPWLLQIANRICFDMLRHRRRETEQPYINPDPTRLSRQECLVIIINLLQKFDSKTRDIVLLYYLEEMTMAEISQHKGISRKTIGKKIAQFSQAVSELHRNEGK